VMDFMVEDVFVSAIFAVACDVLATIGEDYSKPRSDVRDLRAWSDRFKAGVVAAANDRNGAARDYDLRAGQWINSETCLLYTS
ncbi:glycogen debranching protein, partial [Mycobacterium tuberculosis]|nr:glycogen debranching protein [Mycobacterium tuberculosis]